MSPNVVRIVDRWLGRPLCAALTAVRWCCDRITGRTDGPSPDEPVRKILVIKMIEQGATVLASAALRRAAELVGRENVYFWVFERNRAILDLMDAIPRDNVFAVRDDSLFHFAFDFLHCLVKIRRRKIDATVDMEFFARASAALAYLAVPRGRRVGLHRFCGEGPFRGDLMTHRLQHNPHLHISVAYLALVEALTKPVEKPVGKFHVSDIDLMPRKFLPNDVEKAQVRRILEEVMGHSVSQPIVLLNPNASDMLPLRRWPTRNFVELGRRILSEQPDATIVITGAPDEAIAAQSIAAGVSPSRAISLAGVTTLRQLMVLYTLADALVTNDSGPGHFASLTNLPTLVLFGPETTALFGPLGDNVRTLSAKLACSPCVNALNHRFSPCSNNTCMQAISVDDCLAAVRQMLGRTPVAVERPAVEVTLHLRGEPAPLAAAR